MLGSQGRCSLLTALQVDEVVGFVWTHFREKRKWPSRKDFIRRLQRDGIPVEAALQAGKLFRTYGGDEEVHADFEALVALSEVRDLFQPLPAVLREAAKRYISNPPFTEDTERATLHFRDLRSLWTDPGQARLAADVMRATDFWPISPGGSSGSDPDDFWFQIPMDVIRFEHVTSLEDVLRVPRHESRAEVGRYPSGKHLALLQRIQAFSRDQQEWPIAVPFAVAVRDVGLFLTWWPISPGGLFAGDSGHLARPLAAHGGIDPSCWFAFLRQMPHRRADLQLAVTKLDLEFEPLSGDQISAASNEGPKIHLCLLRKTHVLRITFQLISKRLWKLRYPKTNVVTQVGYSKEPVPLPNYVEDYFSDESLAIRWN